MQHQPNFENLRRSILRKGPPGPVPLFELFADPGMVEAILEEKFPVNLHRYVEEPLLDLAGDDLPGLMKSIDLFIGIKAEQTLRDGARNAQEESPDESDVPELCPIGKKDWIAGKRLGPYSKFGELEGQRLAVIKQLIRLGSHQRIRQDNLRIYAVRPPVPVFKDAIETMEPEIEEAEEAASDDDTQTCPICGAQVHQFNLQFGLGDKVVGCYLCRGEPQST